MCAINLLKVRILFLLVNFSSHFLVYLANVSFIKKEQLLLDLFVGIKNTISRKCELKVFSKDEAFSKKDILLVREKIHALDKEYADF